MRKVSFGPGHDHNLFGVRIGLQSRAKEIETD